MLTLRAPPSCLSHPPWATRTVPWTSFHSLDTQQINYVGYSIISFYLTICGTVWLQSSCSYFRIMLRITKVIPIHVTTVTFIQCVLSGTTVQGQAPLTTATFILNATVCNLPTALMFTHEHTYIYYAIIWRLNTIEKKKVNLCSHYGTFRHSLQSTKKCQIYKCLYVYLSALASGTIEHGYSHFDMWHNHSKLFGYVIFSCLTHKFTLHKSINELLYWFHI